MENILGSKNGTINLKVALDALTEGLNAEVKRYYARREDQRQLNKHQMEKRNGDDLCESTLDISIEHRVEENQRRKRRRTDIRDVQDDVEQVTNFEDSISVYISPQTSKVLIYLNSG